MPLASIGLCKKVLKELFCVKPKQNFNRTIQVKIKKKEHEWWKKISYVIPKPGKKLRKVFIIVWISVVFGE